MLRRLNSFLVSPKLALALLLVILGCCLVGVTVYRGARAWEVIFSALWFNALLVLLAVSSFAAFIGRTWKRKLTVVQAGMILFHVSFGVLLGGVVYNGLFRFKGEMRITEGEALRSDDSENYDAMEKGRLFSFSRLRGETTLVELHRDYEVDGQNKRAAYEVRVHDGERKAQEIIYFTRHLDFEGVRYFPSKEGYSVLVVMSAADGRELYGGHVPLQSLRQPDGSYLYATGTAEGAGAIPFPAAPEPAIVGLQLFYRPNAVVERSGEVTFELWPLEGHVAEPRRSHPVPIGGSYNTGGLALSPREIRYWVSMNVRYDPGLNVALGSLVGGFVGMTLTFVGRVRQGATRRRAA